VENLKKICCTFVTFLLVYDLSLHSVAPTFPAVQPALKHAPKQHLQGRITGDRYYSYGNTFSIPLPTSDEASHIEDFYVTPNIGGVAFFNDYGFLLKIEKDELIPEVISIITQHPEIKEEMLDALFYDALVPQIKITAPKLQILFEKKIRLASGEPALFAVLNYPEGATVMDTVTGVTLDSKRGYLIFFSENKALMSFTLQDTLSFIPSIADAAKSRLNARLLHHLEQYQSTFQAIH